MITGKTTISEEVFIELAKTALNTVDSIFTASEQKRSLASIARIVADRVAPQISVRKFDAEEDSESLGSVSFELKINILYGQNVPATINNVRTAVKTEVESITGYNVEKIDVIVEKLVKPEPAETNDSKEAPDIIETE